MNWRYQILNAKSELLSAENLFLLGGECANRDDENSLQISDQQRAVCGYFGN